VIQANLVKEHFTSKTLLLEALLNLDRSSFFAIWCDGQIANILNQKVFPQSFPNTFCI
jgi:hypothetical protein